MPIHTIFATSNEVKNDFLILHLQCRLVLSDSIHFIQGIVGANVNPLLDSKSIDTMCLIQVTSHAVQALRGHWYTFHFIFS